MVCQNVALDYSQMQCQKYSSKPENSKKMAALGPHISIITLNVNGFNSPIKRHRVAGWIKEQTHQDAASRKHISALNTNTGLERRDGR